MRKFNFSRMDAAENAFFERAFEHVEANLYDYKQGELLARTLVPKVANIAPETSVYSWRGYSQVGVAKIIASYADDLPRADVKGEENFSVVKSIGASFGYNIMEIRQARRAGTPLEQAKANAARRAVEEQIEELLSVGSTQHNIIGLLNQPNATLYTVPNGASASPLWANKTGAEIIADLIGIQLDMISLTKSQEKPNVIALSAARLSLISTKFFDPDVSDKTILEVFLSVSPHVKRLVEWNRLATAGVGNSQRILCYRQSLDALGAIIPQEFETFSPQEQGLEFVTPCHARCGGVIAYYPLSISYGDGI